jgi:putative membrane protein
MTMLNTEQQLQVTQAIAAVEKNTDAELVAVLAARSDRYDHIPLLWAALLALLTPLMLMLLPFWLSAGEIFLIQIIIFLITALLLRIPAIGIRFIPRRVRYWRAANMARRQFLENNLHHTAADSGILIFVSEAEHYVEIIADRGIDRKVGHEKWQSIVDDFVAAVRRGETLEGFLTCINACGTLLQQHVPATHSKNELPDRLIILK